MKTMTLYRISFADLGDKVKLFPGVPKSKLNDEESTIPRICCCPSIIGCIQSIELGSNPYYHEFNNRVNSIPGGIDVYLYKAEVDIENIYQPKNWEVGDVWITGEFWVMQPQIFVKVSEYNLKKHMTFPNCPYSRYAMQKCDSEYEICDRIYASSIYGDYEQFSFIALDQSIKDENIDTQSDMNNLDTYLPK